MYESQDYNDEGRYLFYLNHTFSIKDQNDQDSETSSIIDDRSFIRVSTAPPRPLTDMQEFKRSTEFMLLEQAIVCSSQLVQKNYQKYDLDTPEGQKICKKYLSVIEKLCDCFLVKTANREYRNEFSKAYKILYKEGCLCYLTEILDSAQEGFPYLWVNGEKYVFSPDVLEAGQKLLSSFFKMQHIMRNAYGRASQENINVSSEFIKQEIQQCLEEFDFSWAKFEQLYVLELMLIETDARRFISRAIEIEKELTSIEIREKIRGKISVQNDEYTNLRKKLCKIISQINSVSNVDGKGRDDLNYDVLEQSEGILRRVTKEQSKAVRHLAGKIRDNFTKLRGLFRKYEQNIEMVDPQLKNNSDLVETLCEYETYWEKGKSYFLDPQKCACLIHFSHIIESTGEKYKQFQDQIDCREADIFMNIPSLMVLKSLEMEDKKICQYFLPEMFKQGHNINKINNGLQQNFDLFKKKHQIVYQYYNILERHLLDINNQQDEQQQQQNEQFQIQEEEEQILQKIIKDIKILACDLSRNNPMEWNQFLDAAISS